MQKTLFLYNLKENCIPGNGGGKRHKGGQKAQTSNLSTEDKIYNTINIIHTADVIYES